MSKVDTTRSISVTVNTSKQVSMLSPIKSSSINSPMTPSTPLTPEELTELRVKLTRESQKINEALKNNQGSAITTRKMKKSISSELLQPTKSILKKSDSNDNIKNMRKIKFSQEVVVGTTHHVEDYDRQTSPSITAFKLNAVTKVDIRSELNEFKKTMEVHEDSVKHTVFYPE